jgi:hypothetical protein
MRRRHTSRGIFGFQILNEFAGHLLQLCQRDSHGLIDFQHAFDLFLQSPRIVYSRNATGLRESLDLPPQALDGSQLCFNFCLKRPLRHAEELRLKCDSLSMFRHIPPRY